ncbi:hypothetical protein JOC77_000430 [Peribacillus deserti]|uniref:Uncharacterized protein n=1 Tax=Peribacillus deserti TaxID=673318 RepID=A0ABS2QCZ7_9BACI|nr:hypothetical protein [Peribacillus deserti]MBM7691027.1 hypothetical protein [Peribacillus deserti]
MTKRDDENISEKQSAEGMMELFEFINAKGDSGELQEIIKDYNSRNSVNASQNDSQTNFTDYHSPDPSQGPANEHNLVCNEELFYSDLRAIAEDSSRED